MQTYSFLRELADSWFLIGMFGFFIAACVYAWRPGAKPMYEETANALFRNEDRPADPEQQARPKVRENTRKEAE